MVSQSWKTKHLGVSVCYLGFLYLDHLDDSNRNMLVGKILQWKPYAKPDTGRQIPACSSVDRNVCIKTASDLMGHLMGNGSSGTKALTD